jgi:pantoate--beta-alanine ligase
MIIFKKAAALSTYISQQKNTGKKIGFVPTMGALHAGHLSLIAASKAENEIVVCSIFVNPTQFNNADDFNHYPSTIEKDIEQLIAAGCTILFLPTVAEVYPADYPKKQYNLGSLENILEGYYRPGHFQGVCQVVDRLLTLINPDNLYMGQKDYQQCMVVAKLLQLTGRTNTQLHFVTTKREEDGLAMSSRNLRLTPEERQKATAISTALHYIKDHLGQQSIQDLEKTASEMLVQKGFKIDYVAITDADNLKPINHLNQQQPIALIAVTIGNIRLIDNMILK